MKGATWVCALLVAVIGLGGPLAGLAAAADVYKEPDYGVPAQYPHPGSARSAAPAPPERGAAPTQGDKVGAFFLNLLYIPGKLVICTTGTVAGTAVMALTLGSGYRQAVGVFKEGCHGDWVLSPEHVAGKFPPKDDVD